MRYNPETVKSFYNDGYVDRENYLEVNDSATIITINNWGTRAKIEGGYSTYFLNYADGYYLYADDFEIGDVINLVWMTTSYVLFDVNVWSEGTYYDAENNGGWCAHGSNSQNSNLTIVKTDRGWIVVNQKGSFIWND